MAGKIDVSRQLFDRSNPSTDTILTQDLAVDYAKQPDSQLLTQATNGVLNQSGTNAATYTDTTPTVPELYPKLADAIQQVAVNRFAPATAICMHRVGGHGLRRPLTRRRGHSPFRRLAAP